VIRAEITAENDRLNSAYKATIMELQQQIDRKSSELTSIYDRLAAAASRRTAVKPPASNQELRKRFTDAGYPPK
jgi:hypothetical protein